MSKICNSMVEVSKGIELNDKDYLNSFYSDSYLTIVGSQTMAAGTRFIMGVIA